MLILFAFLGLLVGSFLNVLVLRTKQGTNFVTGRSECPQCKRQLTWYELIPVVSYVVQKGKCRGCHKHISAQYPMVEAITASTFALLYLHFGIASSYAIFSLVCWLFASSLLIAAAVYDARWYLLPDSFTLPTIFIGIIYVVASNTLFGQHDAIQHILMAGLFAVLFTTLNLISSGKWLGDGDIRLAIIMGLMLSFDQFVVAVFFSFNIAAAVSLWLIATHRKSRKDIIPLGPFLVVGTLLGLFLGGAIMKVYLPF